MTKVPGASLTLPGGAGSPRGAPPRVEHRPGRVGLGETADHVANREVAVPGANPTTTAFVE